MDAFTRSFLLLFVLLNPFILSVYLLSLVRTLSLRRFVDHLTRAGLISLLVFVTFAWAGEAIFEDVLQVRFAAFLVFGGITFLLIGIRLILGLGPPVDLPSPETGRTSASIAVPFLIGPGTISASVLSGTRLPPMLAAGAILLAMLAAIGSVILIKIIHDYVSSRNERLVRRYSEIAGRATALFTGAFAIEMIFTGLERWSFVLAQAP